MPSYEEIQLDFAFVAEGEKTPATLEKQVTVASHPTSFARPRGLSKAMGRAQEALLEAPLAEVSGSLLAIFEFCEAALTRALDVTALRQGELFSPEELRSLRGIGQAQWLLNEAQMRRETKTATEGKERKSKKMMNDE